MHSIRPSNSPVNVIRPLVGNSFNVSNNVINFFKLFFTDCLFNLFLIFDADVNSLFSRCRMSQILVSPGIKRFMTDEPVLTIFSSLFNISILIYSI